MNNKHFDNLEMRQAMIEAILELIPDYPDIVVLDADLAGASGFKKIFQKYPDHCLNAGIAEANMVGLAAGLSLAGKIPFAHSFAPFITRRALDQIYMACAYQKANVRLFGTDPGYWSAHNGGTHTSFEDIAVLNAISGLEIFAPSDPVQMDWLTRSLVERYGVFYIRSPRKLLPRLYPAGKTFDPSVPEVLHEGDDVVVFAIGALVSDALAVAAELKDQGINMTVVDVFRVKPLNEGAILDLIQGKKLVVTAENHSKTGGLGSLVGTLMAEHALAVPLRRVGIPDRFGEVGTVPVLKQKYEVDQATLKETILDALDA